MKVVLTSLLTLLLGVAAGWRWNGSGEAAAPGGESKANGSERSLQRAAENQERAAEVLGEGWCEWAARIEAAETQEELESLFAELMATENRKLFATAGRLLGARWAEVDPAAGLQFLKEAKSGSGVLYPMLTEWAMRDLDAVLAGLDAMPAKASYRVKESLLKLLVKRDPDATLAFMRATRRIESHVGNRDDWRELARARPREFAELITEIETENLKAGRRYSAYTLIRIAAAALAEEDPEAALDWGEGLYAKIKDDVLRTAMRTWAEQDPLVFAERLAVWKAEKPPRSDRARAASVLSEIALARAMAGEEPEAAARWLAARLVKPEHYAKDVALKIGQKAQSYEEVYDALAGVESHKDYVRQAVFGGMWRHLGVEDLEEAFGVLEAKPEGEARAVALGGLLRETMSLEPATMVALLGRVPAGSEREAMLREVFRGQNIAHRGHLVKEAMGALPPADRASAIAALFDRDPERSQSGIRPFQPRVFAEALRTAPVSSARSEAAEHLALHWGHSDPVAAMEWAADLPGEEAVAATGAAARAWAPRDAWSLADYLLESPPGQPRDAATVVLAESVQDSEPDSAWLWTARIDDPGMRLESRRAVIEGWAARQPVEARDAVESADMPVTEREALRALLNR